MFSDSSYIINPPSNHIPEPRLSTPLQYAIATLGDASYRMSPQLTYNPTSRPPKVPYVIATVGDASTQSVSRKRATKPHAARMPLQYAVAMLGDASTLPKAVAKPHSAPPLPVRSPPTATPTPSPPGYQDLPSCPPDLQQPTPSRNSVLPPAPVPEATLPYRRKLSLPQGLRLSGFDHGMPSPRDPVRRLRGLQLFA
ncbi:hypothetical protein M407DRAFT_28667 [Tulasnella calospora MUT 4182]|uniref:Uncharacterized protein n=1 Tax=Tulasnella calospora MUT 4182 TaxID=1051891 RepID=A0A0C3QAA0_9AGAM|nr:hypothetical protein M407DRAFT_28667 [Tulasnella calospora MUT 4182]